MATAFVFSGQGAQKSGMGKDIYQKYAEAKKVFDIIEGYREGTREQCFSGTSAELAITINTQPCMFTVEMAQAYALSGEGIKAQAAAGFSLGEIAALTYSEVFTLEDGIKIIMDRARIMHTYTQDTQGVMVAVLKLDSDTVDKLATQHNVYAVNYNCPGQTVVAGMKDNIDSFVESVKQNKGRSVYLKVSGAFHSVYMNDAADDFLKELDKYNFNEMNIPVYANATANIYQNDIKKTMATQIKSPVLWQKTIENMIDNGIDTFIELGCGNVLTNLIKKINADVTAYTAIEKLI